LACAIVDGACALVHMIMTVECQVHLHGTCPLHTLVQCKPQQPMWPRVTKLALMHRARWQHLVLCEEGLEGVAQVLGNADHGGPN
jgi:hypothetical protein